jgi:hypothetical protein
MVKIEAERFKQRDTSGKARYRIGGSDFMTMIDC